MTCLVGWAGHGQVVIGADTATTSNSDIRTRAEPKVFKRTVGADAVPMLIAHSGSPRASQLVRYALELPEMPEPTTGGAERWLATVFVDGLRECLKGGGHARRDDEEESWHGMLLVGVYGRLFTIHTDYQIVEHPEPYSSLGAGQAYALGACAVLEELGMAKLDAWGLEGCVMAALEAAEKFCTSVRRPFNIVALPETALSGSSG